MPRADTLLLAAVLVVAGATLLVVARKQAAGTLRRNQLVGLRTGQTLRSDAAWYEAHRRTAGLITAAGSVLVLSGLALLVLQPAGDGALAAIVLGSGGLTLLLVVIAGIRADGIAAEVHTSGSGPHDRVERP